MSARSVRTRLSILGVVATLALTAACSGQAAPQTTGKQSETPSPVAHESVATIASNIPAGAGKIGIDRKIRLTVEQGTFSDVQVTGPKGSIVEGRLSEDKTAWVSTARLQAASRYLVTSTAVDADGLENSYEAKFRTRTLSLDEQTYPSFVPLQGQTVGVGMPVIIRFDVPIADQAGIERHLDVTSKPAQTGAFHWVSAQEVHWRPRTYWQPGTDVTVTANIKGVPAGNGIYGQTDRKMNFQVGRSMVSKVNINTHQMRVFRDGKLVRTIPITTGEQPKFTTRSGVKVIVEKFRHKRMNSETIGIDPASADGYDLDDVEYAMRVTYSGEFLHSAPWSVSSQGRDNVSHGCTGMSPANAAWFYGNSTVGDVVEYAGSSRQMTLTNGFGDWNASFASYKAGSALS